MFADSGDELGMLGKSLFKRAAQAFAKPIKKIAAPIIRPIEKKIVHKIVPKSIRKAVVKVAKVITAPTGIPYLMRAGKATPAPAGMTQPQIDAANLLSAQQAADAAAAHATAQAGIDAANAARTQSELNATVQQPVMEPTAIPATSAVYAQAPPSNYATQGGGSSGGGGSSPDQPPPDQSPVDQATAADSGGIHPAVILGGLGVVGYFLLGKKGK